LFTHSGVSCETDRRDNATKTVWREAKVDENVGIDHVDAFIAAGTWVLCVKVYDSDMLVATRVWVGCVEIDNSNVFVRALVAIKVDNIDRGIVTLISVKISNTDILVFTCHGSPLSVVEP
jgi:hypothetical protein